MNRGFTLTFQGGGSYRGRLSGTGTVAIEGDQRPEAALVLGGKEANTIKGAWQVKAGRLVLAREPGTVVLGGTITVGGGGDSAGLVWNNNSQVEPSARLRVLKSAKGGAYLDLNGFRETVDRVELDNGTKIRTDGAAGSGILTARELALGGKTLPRGVYTSSSAWVQGGGYVIVGDVRSVDVAGNIDDPLGTIGAGNLAVLRGATTIKLPGGECTIPINLGAFPLTLSTGGGAMRFGGFVTGNGPVRIEAGGQPLEITGASANSYRGPTVLVRGVLKLSKSGGAMAVPGNLEVGGSAPENKGDGVLFGADGQLSPAAVVHFGGNQPSFLDLAGHKSKIARLVLSKATTVRTGEGGTLQVHQLSIAGKRLPDGVYRGPLPWLSGSGKVVVDARVDVRGRIGDLAAHIGAGNIANLIGDTAIAYPASACDVDVLTNGHTLTLDSGDGNPLSCSGVISGTGKVKFFSGPSHTDHRDSPLRLTGARANTTTGAFYVLKGRVQLEKPDGVDAISANVIVGGHGFNDCLFWVKSNQIKDSAHITLRGAGKNGSGYLHLNGCSETVAGLTLFAGNLVKTDSATGDAGTLTVKFLAVDGIQLPAGVYTAATAKWIEGKGRVVVQP
jgi:hypothetical protein